MTQQRTRTMMMNTRDLRASDARRHMSVVERGPASQRMLQEALHQAQATADADGRVMSIWESRRMQPGPRAARWVPSFTIVRGTAPPPGALVVRAHRAEAATPHALAAPDPRVALAAIVRPTRSRRQRRRAIRVAARARRRLRGW